MLCRSGFDTEYMVNNDEVTGLISYIGCCLNIIEYFSKNAFNLVEGKKFTKIQYDLNLYQVFKKKLPRKTSNKNPIKNPIKNLQ